MSNETDTTSANLYAQVLYLDITAAQATVASLSLLIYGSMLHLSDEVEYIWKRKFKMPAFLYLLSKYPTILFMIVQVAQTVLPSLSISACNDLGITIAVLSICSTIGVQGLISLRTYSICQGYRPMAIALFITFLLPIGVEIYLVTLPGCSASITTPLILDILSFIRDILTILLDVLAFIGVIHQVWGVWKLKRSVGSSLQNNNGKDLVTLLLQQGILRFGFVLCITTVTTVLALTRQDSIADVIFVPFQQVLAVLLICDFTIALRKRNMRTPTPNLSILSLASFRLASSQTGFAQNQRTIFVRLNDNLITEMGETNDPVDIDVVDDLGDGSDMVL